MHLSLRCTIALAVLTGCQAYDFEPVEPLAVSQATTSRTIIVNGVKPDLMMMVDRSGSMGDPIDGSLAACVVGGKGCGSLTGVPCPAGCATRMSELKSAMSGFLDRYGKIARLGLAVFPEATAQNSCGTGTLALDVVQSEDVESELQARAGEVNAAIQALTPGGGTPTSATLRMIGGLSSLRGRERPDFVVLLTDGLPNCNPANPAALTSCGCTSTQGNCTLQCLDRDETVAAIRALGADEIQTIVVGFGADTATGPAVEALNAMAAEGGFARWCASDTDCGGGDHCGANNSCDRKFYQASNATELGAAFEKITEVINPLLACTIRLEPAPSDERFLSVLVNGVAIPRGPATWTYSAGKIELTAGGAPCAEVQASTVKQPTLVEIRVVEPL